MRETTLQHLELYFGQAETIIFTLIEFEETFHAFSTILFGILIFLRVDVGFQGPRGMVNKKLNV